MKNFKSLIMLLVVLFCMPAIAQQLPMDTAVRYGKLPNGLTYYVRHNALPKERVNFYIAQKVGSVQEEEEQRGLAHFLEHMCFNGTKHFPGNGIVKFCERIGVKFGVNLNAYTSTDETVYNIDDVPVSDLNIDSCLLILRDWSDGLTLDPKEIDKERGVIHEEWRMRSSATMRIYERNLPTLYPGSRYGHRFPIGLMSVIDNFKPEALRAYYEKWYRPDLQGIIVVGDIDVDAVEAKIKSLFADIQMPKNPAAYEHYPVPANPEAIYIVDKDKEQAQPVIMIQFKNEPMPAEYKNTPVFLAQNLITGIMTSVVNSRLNELSQKPDCPFVGAGVYYGDYLVSKTMEAVGIQIVPKQGQDAAAVQAVMQEVERAARFGLTATEVIRAREEFMSQLESIYDNRDKQKHNFYIPQYVRHFLEGDPIPDLSTEYNLYKALAPQLPVEAYNQVFAQSVASVDTNFVLLAMYPDKEGFSVPTADELKAAVMAAKAAELTAYVDNVKNEPLVPEVPAAGKIKKEKAAPFGYTEWTLSNGARVYFRKTDFNESQVLFSARSFGGQSLLPESDLLNATLLGIVMNSTGWGNFSSVELEKKLAGKQASVQVSLGQNTDNLSGSSTPKDLRTLFELIYLHFQKPADDQAAYDNIINLLKTQLANAEKDPSTAFSDSIRTTLYNNHPRVKGLKLEDLAEADYAAIKRIYSERFATAGDFDFYFTGNFDVDSLRAFTETYIASLPAQKKREKFVNHKIYFRTGTVENRFKREMEVPQGNLIQVWSGELDYSMKNAVVLNALGQILTQRYLKSIREDGGLAYSVQAMGQADTGVRDEYAVQIVCPVKPAQADSALLLMQQGIDDIAKSGVTAEELDKVKKYELKEYANQQIQNGYWQGLVISQTRWGYDAHTGYEEVVNNLTSADIQNFVRNVLLKHHNRITVTMLPESLEENH
ncbi:MAG: insulinase family protein [Bacteroidaceae bacterium]|nr:insulinase family protein [Bacteroidaceae bacterium]